MQAGNRAYAAAVEDRFWSHVDRGGGPDACWPWLLGTDDDGYGRVWFVPGDTRAHKVALQFHLGRPLAHGMVAMHSCDVPICCNPRHLTEGTRARNNADRAAKGRSDPRRGELNQMAVLTANDVGEVRRVLSATSRGNKGAVMAAFAARFGLTRWAIESVAYGRTWRHLPSPRPATAERSSL